jgi:hypothetical protein
MKKTLVLTAIAAGFALVGCNKATRSTASTSSTEQANYASATSDTPNRASVDATTTNNNSLGSRIDAGINNASNAASHAVSSATTQARIMEWKLSASDIQADLNNNNPIVRTKDSAAGAPTGSVDKSVIKSSVEGRLAADSEVSALKLDVNAKKDGEVELEGKAMSAEQVGKAIALALDTDGVNKVTSKIKLDKDAKTNR